MAKIQTTIQLVLHIARRHFAVAKTSNTLQNKTTRQQHVKVKKQNKKTNINNGFNKSHHLGHSVPILATIMAYNLNALNKLMFLNTISKKRIFIIKCCTEGPMLRTVKGNRNK